MKLSSTCELNEDPFTYTEGDIIAAAGLIIHYYSLRTNYSLLL